MTNRKVFQFGLIFTGLFLILMTYFFYPIIKEKEAKLEETIVKDEPIITKEEETNTFTNVEYQGFYNINNPFTIKSERAYILEDDPELPGIESEIIYMTNMHVILYLNDGRIVNITSDKGRYNKVTYDCYFENNVKATDGENVMLAENLDLLSNADSVTVYNKVVLTSDQGSLRADKIDYNFQTKYYHISTFDNRKVKIKLY